MTNNNTADAPSKWWTVHSVQPIITEVFDIFLFLDNYQGDEEEKASSSQNELLAPGLIAGREIVIKLCLIQIFWDAAQYTYTDST